MSTTTKQPLAVVMPSAERLVKALAPYCERIELAGSLRREKPHVGDIEVVAIPQYMKNLLGEPLPPPSMLDLFLDTCGVQFAKRGERYQQFKYGRHTVDLFLVSADTWGSVFTIRTGSWEFSKWLVTSQAARGAKPEPVAFKESRLLAYGRLLATPEEADVFAAVGLEWIPPAERHGPIANPVRCEPVWNYADEDPAVR